MLYCIPDLTMLLPAVHQSFDTRLDMPPKLDVIMVPFTKHSQSYNPRYGVLEAMGMRGRPGLPLAHLYGPTYAITPVYTCTIVSMVMSTLYFKYSKTHCHTHPS